jgi:hypothetical protein
LESFLNHIFHVTAMRKLFGLIHFANMIVFSLILALTFFIRDSLYSFSKQGLLDPLFYGVIGIGGLLALLLFYVPAIFVKDKKRLFDFAVVSVFIPIILFWIILLVIVGMNLTNSGFVFLFLIMLSLLIILILLERHFHLHHNNEEFILKNKTPFLLLALPYLSTAILFLGLLLLSFFSHNLQFVTGTLVELGIPCLLCFLIGLVLIFVSQNTK